VTLARRTGLWALAWVAAGVVRLFWQALAPQPRPVIQRACSVPVEVRGPGGPIVGCGTDPALAGAGPLHSGDAVLGHPTLRAIPGGMGDAMRLALGLPLDVNRASAACLALVPGLSPAVAHALVSDRSLRGPFPNVEALRRVRGVGPATLRRARPHLCAGGQHPGQCP
jgi:competence protein ComEA